MFANLEVLIGKKNNDKRLKKKNPFEQYVKTFINKFSGYNNEKKRRKIITHEQALLVLALKTKR